MFHTEVANRKTKSVYSAYIKASLYEATSRGTESFREPNTGAARELEIFGTTQGEGLSGPRWGLVGSRLEARSLRAVQPRSPSRTGPCWYKQRTTTNTDAGR